MEDELILEPLHQNHVPVSSKSSHPPTIYPGNLTGVKLHRVGDLTENEVRQPVKCGLSETNNFMEMTKPA